MQKMTPECRLDWIATKEKGNTSVYHITIDASRVFDRIQLNKIVPLSWTQNWIPFHFAGSSQIIKLFDFQIGYSTAVGKEKADAFHHIKHQQQHAMW